MRRVAAHRGLKRLALRDGHLRQKGGHHDGQNEADGGKPRQATAKSLDDDEPG